MAAVARGAAAVVGTTTSAPAAVVPPVVTDPAAVTQPPVAAVARGAATVVGTTASNPAALPPQNTTSPVAPPELPSTAEEIATATDGGGTAAVISMVEAVSVPSVEIAPTEVTTGSKVADLESPDEVDVAAVTTSIDPTLRAGSVSSTHSAAEAGLSDDLSVEGEETARMSPPQEGVAEVTMAGEALGGVSPDSRPAPRSGGGDGAPVQTKADGAGSASVADVGEGTKGEADSEGDKQKGRGETPTASVTRSDSGGSDRASSGFSTLLSSAANTASAAATINVAAATPTSSSAVAAAATPPLGMTLAASMNQPGWERAMGERVVWMVRNNLQLAQIQLNPRDMGPIDVRLSVNQDQQATVSFVASNAVTREALEASLPRLREMFQDAGIQLTDSEVSQHQQQGDGRTQQQGGPKVAQQGADGSEVHDDESIQEGVAHVGSSGVNLFA